MLNAPLFLKSQAVVELSQPAAILQTLCKHFEEHGEVAYDDRQGSLQTPYGNARLEAGETTLTLYAEGRDETYLSYIKWSLAEHLVDFAKEDAPVIEWSGEHHVGQLLPFFREMTVVSSREVTPMMRRLTLNGQNLARFATGGLHVRLLLPLKGVAPEWPVMGMDGRPQWPQADRRPIARIYTIRSIDPEKGMVDIDMVLHEGSAPGSDFARFAQPGDIVGMLGPSGSHVPEADWYLFAGDETALPAIARELERLPASAHAVVRIEVADRGEEQALPSAASLDLQYLHRNGCCAGKSSLLKDAVLAVECPKDGCRVFAWSGTEHQTFKALRKFMRADMALPREQHWATGYWRLNAAGDH